MIACSIVDVITGTPLGQIAPASFSGGRVIDDSSEGRLQMALPHMPYTRDAMNDFFDTGSRAVEFSHNGVPLAKMQFTDDDFDDDTHTQTMLMEDVWSILGDRTTLGSNGYSGDKATDNELNLQNIALNSVPGFLIWAGTEGPTVNFDLPIFLPEGKITNALVHSLPSAGPENFLYEDTEFPNVREQLGVLAKLGVEIDFAPRRSTAGNSELLMRVGKLTGPHFECNMTSEKPWLSHVHRRKNSDKEGNVHYSVGKGAGRDMRVTTSRATTSKPARERSEVFKDIEDYSVLQRLSDGNLATFNKPTIQWEMSMLADSSAFGGPQIEEVTIGSTIAFYYMDHPKFDDGWTEARVIGFNFDETERVNLILQKEGPA